LVLLCGLLSLFGCESMTEDKLILAADLLIEHELDANYRDFFDSWDSPPWNKDSARITLIDEDRMPTWAIEQYDICVRWEDDYFSKSEIAQRGEDMIRIREGLGWGWILINKELEFHILETGIRWTVQEDGIETQSGSKTFIDAWQQPADE